MKFATLLLSTTALLLGDSARIATAQTSYPLICRGGPSMRFLAHEGNVQHTYNILGLFFTAGTRPAGPRGRDLAPGQCSWVDRGFRPGEPDILQQEVAANVTSQPWFRELKNPAIRWTFYVYNTRQGVMKITRASRTGSIDE